MTKSMAFAYVVIGLLSAAPALAGEAVVTLRVQNMTCAACPYTVKASLESVPGVAKAVVSFADKTAVVTFDDARTDVTALTAATGNAGYPSAPED